MAEFTILATADLHLGMKFAGYPEVQEELSTARFEALDTIVSLGNDISADLLLVAGDLFDRLKVSKKDIVTAASSLNHFEGRAAAVLPGNHDFHSGRDSLLWASFAQETGDRVVILEEKRPYPLDHYDIPAVLYPAPCDAPHSAQHRAGWIGGVKDFTPELLHVGVIHSSIRGISPDFDDRYYPVDPAELQRLPMDVWFAGHTHKPLEKELQKNRLYISGTPEPDGFDCDGPGQVWVTGWSDKKVTRAELVETGRYRFIHREMNVTGSEDLEEEISRIAGDQRERTLLKLVLHGILSAEELEKVQGILAGVRRDFFYLETDDSLLRQKITKEKADREFATGSFPHRLLVQLLEKQDDNALQTAYDILREVKG